MLIVPFAFFPYSKTLFLAFDLLVRKDQHRIVALIGRYIHDWSECQDVAQDTFMRAYRAIGNFRGDAQFYT